MVDLSVREVRGKYGSLIKEGSILLRLTSRVTRSDGNVNKHREALEFLDVHGIHGRVIRKRLDREVVFRPA